MDCRTGDIYPDDVIRRLIASGAITDPHRFKQMVVPPTPKQLEKKTPKIGRNDPCPCGSGVKFKKCCLRDPVDKRFE